MKTNRILVVDDKEDNRYLLCALLQGNGYEVATAAQGAEALDLARQKPPDLIITDVLMPVMDGFALCRAWKQDARLSHIPFIFYTATYTDERDRDFGLRLGANEFIVKPEEPEALLAIVRETIRKNGSPPPEPARPSADESGTDERVFLKQYNEALVRKLETKMEQLQQANRQMEQDLVERRRTEEELRRTNVSLDSIIENIPNMLFLKDARDLRFVRCNRAGEELLGLAKGDLIGKSDHDLFPKEQADFFTQKDREVLQGKKVLDIPEEPLQTRHKGTRTLHTWKVPVLNAQGEPEYLLGISEDITDRKQAENERKRLQAQLTQAQKMESVGRLAGGVAHDFNNMLGAILGHAEMALEDISPDHPLHANLMEIMKATKRSADLTRQLLAFARKQTVAPQVLDLNQVIGAMFQMLKRLIGEDIALSWQPAPALWPLRVDPSQIDQILANLSVNARDAIADVGMIAIETGNTTFDEDYCAAHAGAVPGEYVFLAVSDTGCGMGPETQSHLFEPFFTTKSVGQGTGLGLATVYGIVKQNNGFISVQSEPGHGTTFRVHLPRYLGKPEPSLQTPRAAAPAARGQETVLLVEDESAILSTSKSMLERLGYQVLGASTPGEAIRLAAEHSGEIHLLLTDVVMPEMNGRDLTRNLLALYPNLKRLFMSGYTADVIAHHGVLYEGVNFIQKPFSMKNLAAKVREVLDGKTTRSEPST